MSVCFEKEDKRFLVICSDESECGRIILIEENWSYVHTDERRPLSAETLINIANKIFKLNRKESGKNA